MERLGLEDQVGLLIGHPICLCRFSELQVKVPQQLGKYHAGFRKEEFGTNAVTLASRKGHKCFPDIVVEALVMAGVTGGQEALRVEVGGVDPEVGRVLDVVNANANDGLGHVSIGVGNACTKEFLRCQG